MSLEAAQRNPVFRQKLFANFMKADDELSYQMYSQKKLALFKDVTGKVLEIGPGTGVNFRFLPKNCQWQGVEPNPAMHPFLKKTAKDYGFHDIQFAGLAKNTFNLADNSQDFIISTLVLCSVPNVRQTLSEIKRVLKPKGKFIFIEHVVDTENTFRKVIQKTMPYTPWRYFSDGCDPSRDIATDINQAGFSSVALTQYKQQGAGIIMSVNRPHIFGTAVK